MAYPRSQDSTVASSSFLRDIIDASPGEILALDTDSFRILLANRNAARTFGLSGEPFIFLDFLAAEAQPDFLQAAQRLRKSPRKPVEIRLQCLDVSESPFDADVRLLDSALDGLDCLLVTVTRRSDESRLKRQLKDAEDRYRALAESANEAVISTDSRGIIRSWNHHAELVFGYPAEQMLGASVERIMPTRFRESHRLGMERFLSTGQARMMGKSVRLCGRHRSGREIPLELSLSTWMRDGQVGFTGQLRELSAHGRADREDRHSRRALLTLSRCNGALLQSCSEQLLLDSLCRLMVSEGGYPLAWVGLMEADGGHGIEVRAQASRDAIELEMNGLRWQAGPGGHGPAAYAIRTERTIITHGPDVERLDLSGPDTPESLGMMSCCSIPLRMAGRLIGAVTVYTDDNDSFGAAERVLLEDLACSLGHGLHASRQRRELKSEITRLERNDRKLRRSLAGTTKAIFRALEARDPETANHQQRVARIAVALGRELHLEEDRIDSLSISACLHDIGKLAVRPELLTMKEELTESQQEELRSHTAIGFGLLQGIDFPWQVAEVAIQHHERVDGKGYPRGLAGEEILLEARIVAVADFVDAVASPRSYRPARGLRETLSMLETEGGRRFDPEVVRACLSLFQDEHRSGHLTAAYL